VRRCAQLLEKGKIVGWFSGGSELGPRALGQRSILCDARSADAKAVLNSKVKHREAFRPFAPAILEERAGDWFDFGATSSISPFMLRVCDVRSDRRHLVPAIVHVDGTARPQTVSRKHNQRLHSLLLEFENLTGVPLLVNTSFNIMGEPIVESPVDALRCLLSTGLDACVFHDRIVFKLDPPNADR